MGGTCIFYTDSLAYLMPRAAELGRVPVGVGGGGGGGSVVYGNTGNISISFPGFGTLMRLCRMLKNEHKQKLNTHDCNLYSLFCLGIF